MRGSAVARSVLALFVGVGVGVGCVVSAPSSGRVSLDGSAIRSQDLIGYRRLLPSDFLAAAVPDEVAASKHTVGGYTCLNLVHDAPISVAPIAKQPRAYRAELVKVNFRAYMNRGCSWLNRSAPLPPAYIMEHEQIHFAIWELQARHMNENAPAVREEVQAVASDPDEAVDATKQKLAGILERALVELRKENRAFDDDTSQGYHPEQQTRWFQRVQDDLARTDQARGDEGARRAD